MLKAFLVWMASMSITKCRPLCESFSAVILGENAAGLNRCPITAAHDVNRRLKTVAENSIFVYQSLFCSALGGPARGGRVEARRVHPEVSP